MMAVLYVYLPYKTNRVTKGYSYRMQPSYSKSSSICRPPARINEIGELKAQHCLKKLIPPDGRYEMTNELTRIQDLRWGTYCW